VDLSPQGIEPARPARNSLQRTILFKFEPPRRRNTCKERFFVDLSPQGIERARRQRVYAALIPPSTFKMLPVLLGERAGEAKKSTASATSSGSTLTLNTVRSL
jgi:hypothetical protein